MNSLQDEIFGVLKYDHLWGKRQQITWNNKQNGVDIFVYATKEQKPTDEQRTAYALFVKNIEAYLNSAVAKLLPFCRKTYDKTLDEKKLIDTINLAEVIFKRNGKWGMTFVCPWESEMKIAAVFKDGNVVAAGLDDLLL